MSMIHRRNGEKQQAFDAFIDRVIFEREKYGSRGRVIAEVLWDEYGYSSPEACHASLSKGLSRRGIGLKGVKSKPDFIEQSPPGLIATDAVDDQGDIVYVPIDEWKELYGTPGSGGVDLNGRINGYFPTEPCFCEDAPETFCPIDSDESEQTLGGE